MNASLNSYLCSLLRLVERSDEVETYLSSECELPSLSSLVQQTILAAKSSPCFCRRAVQPPFWQPNPSSWILPKVDELYSINLLKKCILTKFRVFCTANTDPTHLRQLCEEVAQAAELFNKQTATLSAQLDPGTHDRWVLSQESTQLTFANFVEMIISHRSGCVASKLFCSCSKTEDVLSVVGCETQFIETFVSAFTVNSSLLCEDQAVQDFYCLNLISTETLDGVSSGSCSGSSNIRMDNEMVKKIGCLVASELWKEVALCLKHKLQSSEWRGRDSIAAATTILSRGPDLAAAAKCLQYVGMTSAMEDEIMEWDKGFQQMLAVSQKPAASKKPWKPVEFMCSSVLPPLRNATLLIATQTEQPLPLNTAASIADHIDHLNTYHHISTPLRISLQAICNILITSLELNLANSNLSILAQSIFTDVPRVCSSVCDMESEICKCLPQLAHFPVHPVGYLKERRMNTSYSAFHNTCSHMHEKLETICIQFHNFLKERYTTCLCKTFPPAKHWKAVGRKSSTHTDDQPSTYCDIIVEQLIVPTVEAALLLEEHSQRSYMELCASILFNEYRRVIVQKKQTYRIPAGRQLLVDFHHLSLWLCSEKLGLLPTTVESLSNLSVVAEIEQGLQLLCGTIPQTGGGVPHRPRDAESCHLDCVRGLLSLPVWSEIAWYNATDWQECIL